MSEATHPSEATAQSGDRLLVLEAVLLLAVVRLGFFVSSFRAVRDATGSIPATGRGRSLDRVVECVDAACRYVPGTTCLVTAVSAQALLGRYGHRTTLRIGVRRATGDRSGIEAHAWVESDGEVVVGGDESPAEFVPLPPLDAGR
jgi:hypothetical protein